jgi:hypothetical protein
VLDCDSEAAHRQLDLAKLGFVQNSDSLLFMALATPNVAEVIDLTLSPEPIVISSRESSPARRTVPKQRSPGKRNKAHYPRPGPSPSLDGNKRVFPERRGDIVRNDAVVEIRVNGGTRNGKGRPSPCGPSELFFIDVKPTLIADAVATSPGKDPLVHPPEIKTETPALLLPAHVSVLSQERNAIPLKMLSPTYSDSESDDYIEYLEYDNRKVNDFYYNL